MKNKTLLRQLICISVAVIIAITAIIPAIAGTVIDLSATVETSTDAPETGTDAPETSTDTPETDTDIPETGTDTPDVPDEPTEPEDPTEPEEPGEGIVAKMSLYARPKAIPLFGHTWLYIENVSDSDIQVGAYTVPAGEGCTLGTFFYSRFDGIGLYYNLESYLSGKYGVREAVCISEYITADELEKVSKQAINRNFWDPITTCSGMPLTIWNSVADRKVVTIPHPLFVFITLHCYSGKEVGTKMYVVDRERVYKQRGFGDDATLDVCNDITCANDF